MKWAHRGKLGAALVAAILLAVDILSMNLAPQLVDHEYLQVLVVAQALIAEVPDNLVAVLDCLFLCFELGPDDIPMRDPIFHIEEEFLHLYYLCTPIRRAGIRSRRSHPR